MPSRCRRLTAFGLANFTRVSRVDQDHAVADARRALGLDLVEVERERAVGDHPREPLERLEVGALELAGLPGEGHRRLAGEQRDQAAGAPHRDALHAHALLGADRVRVGLDELARPPRAREQRPLDLVDDGADEVLRIVGLAR